jgi:hypothetical protein
MPHRPTRSIAAGLIGVVALLGVAACGNSSDGTTTTSTTAAPASTTTPANNDEATKVFDKQIQQELQTVGCYKGNIDGILGPASDEAILEFQRAEGLSADGELGPKTEAALKTAVAAGKKVCTGTSTTTTPKTSTTKPNTTVAPNDAPCTATALLKGLPAEGEKITRFVCSGGWAAGSLDNGSKFILKAQNGAWYAPSQDPCGSASAGLDPSILEAGCGS